MSFDLQRILKSLLFSTSEPLSVKDIQAVVARWHDTAEAAPPDEDEAAAETAPGEGAPRPDKPESFGPGEEPTKPEPHAGPDGQTVMEPVLGQVPSLLTGTQIREAMDKIADDLLESGEVYRLQQGPQGYRLVIAPQYADWVRLLRGEPRPRRLSPAALETLAIVAYRQPVTRSEIEAIRGVSADGALSRLMEHELIHVSGRAELPGRPLQYATTEAFLEYTGIKSLEELPASDVLSPGQISEWIRQATQPAPDSAAVGLPE